MKTPVFSLILIISFLFFASCGSFNPFSKGPSSKEIGPEGGMITSSDGKVILDFPAGALSTTEMIGIEKIDPKLLGPEFDQIRTQFTIYSAYELSPNGLTFDTPVHATVQSGQKTKKSDGSITLEAEMLFSSSGGVLKILENPEITRSLDSKVAVQGELRSFSKLVHTTNLGVISTIVTRDDMERMNTERSFESVVSLTPRINWEINNAIITQTFQRPLNSMGGLDISQLTFSDNNRRGYQRTFYYKCVDNGSASLQTKGNFTFSSNPRINILTDTPYNYKINQSIKCIWPEDEDDKDTPQAENVVDLGGPVVRDRTWTWNPPNLSVGLDLGISTRTAFKNPVSNQPGLIDFKTDPLSITYGLSLETKMGRINTFKNSPGLSAGISYDYSNARFEQAWQPQEGFPDYTSGKVNFHTATGYLHFTDLVNFRLKNADFKPFITTGAGIIWNNGKYTLDFSDDPGETRSRNHNTAFPYAGIGTDVRFSENFWTRVSGGRAFNVGADSNWNLKLGFRYDIK